MLVPIEEGIVRDVRTSGTHKPTQRAEWEWFAKHGLTRDKARDHASDWGTGIGIWECKLRAGTKP